MGALISSPTRQNLEDLERSKRLAETLQVLAQPHRRGNDTDMVDPLGQFVKQHCGGARMLWEAGWDYFRLVYRWRVVKGIPVALRLAEGENSAGGIMDSETVSEWTAKIKACEFELKRSGLSVFHAAQGLLIDGVWPEDRHVPGVKRGLYDLAGEFGKCS